LGAVFKASSPIEHGERFAMIPKLQFSAFSRRNKNSEDYTPQVIAQAEDDLQTLISTYDIPADVVELARQSTFYEGLEDHHYGISTKPIPFLQMEHLTGWVQANRKKQ
jgi:hypothetical protein